jgi:hypothetical protein
MDFELCPTIALREGSFNVLVAPKEMFIQALNKNLNLQRYKVLFVSGNYSGILSKLDRRFTELEIRRGFTVFQLITILEEAYHSLIIVEHDPMLYEDEAEMVEFISHALGDASKGAAALLYSHAFDPFLEGLMRNADRVFYFEEGLRTEQRMVAKALPKMQRD